MKRVLHLPLNSQDIKKCNCFWVPYYDLFASDRKAVHGKGPRNYNVQPRLVGWGVGGVREKQFATKKYNSPIWTKVWTPPPTPPPIKNSWIRPRIIISGDETIVSQAVLYVPTKFKQIYDLTNAEQLLRLVNYLHQRWNIIWEIKFILFGNSQGTQHNAIKFHSSVREKSMWNAQGHGNYTCAYNFWSFACRMTCKHFLIPFVVNTSNYFILHPWIQGHFRDLLSNSRTRSLSPLPGHFKTDRTHLSFTIVRTYIPKTNLSFTTIMPRAAAASKF